MAKPTSRPGSPRPEPPAPPARPIHAVVVLFAILLFMLGLGLLGNEITSIGWRLKALTYYKEGTARVERTHIYERQGAFELETTYRLEWDGKIGKSTASLDRDDRWASTMEEAVKRQSRITVGKLYPCWYSAGDPENYNLFAPEGIQLGPAFLRLLIPTTVILIAIVLFRWAVKPFKSMPTPPDD